MGFHSFAVSEQQIADCSHPLTPRSSCTAVGELNSMIFVIHGVVEHTVITRSDKPDDSIVTSLRIPVVFNNLARGKGFTKVGLDVYSNA